MFLNPQKAQCVFSYHETGASKTVKGNECNKYCNSETMDSHSHYIDPTVVFANVWTEIDDPLDFQRDTKPAFDTATLRKSTTKKTWLVFQHLGKVSHVYLIYI